MPAVLQKWQLVPSETSCTAFAHEVALAGILGSSSSGGPTESPALCQGVRAQLREAEGSAVIGGLLGELMTGLLLGRIAVAHF